MVKDLSVMRELFCKGPLHAGAVGMSCISPAPSPSRMCKTVSLGADMQDSIPGHGAT